MQTILIVEDEQPIAELIALTLGTVGYQTVSLSDGLAARAWLQENKPDLALLDLMLPQVDGFELLPELVRRGVPVIVLTARDSLTDKVKGLNLGADDYMTKPFAGVELVARVRSVLRRTQKANQAITVDDLEISVDQRLVRRGGEEIALTPKEFDLLVILLENQGLALSRERLLTLAWGYDFAGDTRTVDMHIQRLRSKLQTERISTVYKVGYRWEKGR